MLASCREYSNNFNSSTYSTFSIDILTYLIEQSFAHEHDRWETIEHFREEKPQIEIVLKFGTAVVLCQ